MQWVPTINGEEKNKKKCQHFCCVRPSMWVHSGGFESESWKLRNRVGVDWVHPLSHHRLSVYACVHSGRVILHRESKKKRGLYSCPYLRQILNDFQNSFAGRLGRQFATKWSLKFPPHQLGVATLRRFVSPLFQTSTEIGCDALIVHATIMCMTWATTTTVLLLLLILLLLDDIAMLVCLWYFAGESGETSDDSVTCK